MTARDDARGLDRAMADVRGLRGLLYRMFDRVADGELADGVGDALAARIVGAAARSAADLLTSGELARVDTRLCASQGLPLRRRNLSGRPGSNRRPSAWKYHTRVSPRQPALISQRLTGSAAR